MKSDRIDYKRKEKILTGSVITSTAVLLGLYLNNGTVVKADSLPNGQDVTQTSSSANTEAGNSANQNENNASGTGSTNSTQTGTNTGSSNSTDQNENSATGTTNDTQTGTTTSPTEETTGQAISDAGDLTRSTKVFRWGGSDWATVNMSFDETTGELTIPGGTEASPLIINNPKPIGDSATDGINYYGKKIKKITIIGKVKIVGNATRLFAYLNNLVSISGLENLDTSEVTNMSSMFDQCNSLENADVSHFDTAKVTSMSYMFSWCMKLTSLNLTNFKTNNVTDMSGMFVWCEKLTSINVSSFDTSRVIRMDAMFGNCKQLTSLDIKNFNTANVTNMASMFFGCESLPSLDVSNFNTSNVITMQSMFSNCKKLTSLDLACFDTSNVTIYNGMFWGCTNLSSLDLSHFKTFKATDMSNMFSECVNLTSLDLRNFDTSNVSVFSAMFSECEKLTSLDLSNFNTAKGVNMAYMFNKCFALTKLDLSNFNTSNVNHMHYMFYSCEHLSVLNIGNFDMSMVNDNVLRIRNMLSGLPSLKIIVLGSKCNLQNSGLAEAGVNSIGASSILDPSSRWINVAGGTVEKPKGNKIWTPAEMVTNYNGPTDHDTYIRFGTVKVHYQDENGNQIAPDEVLTGKVGDSYQSTEKTINGYTFKEVKGGATGTIEETAKEVTYVYTKNPVMSKVTVHYQDENGNQIAPDEVLTGKVGDNYQSVQKTINGYTFKEVKGGATGTIEETAKEVTYVYTKNPVMSKVTVHYQDENGNQIAPDEVLTGKVGDNYQSVQKTINGYTFKEVRGNATGFFTANEQTVTYIYTKDDETATTTLPNYVPKPAKPNRNKPNNTNKLTGTNNQTATDKNQQKVAKSLAGDPNEAKTDSLPQTGASNEDKGILSILGSMMLLVSSIGGAWFKRKQK